MASTGDIFPGTGENVDRAGAGAWTAPGNVVSDNATDATNTVASDYLVARSFDFSSIPAGATILGITVRVEASEHSSGTEALSAQLQDASAALVGSVKQQTISGTTKVVYTYGGTADTWSASPTLAMVQDADFGVRLWYTTAQDLRIDFVTIAIEYSVASHYTLTGATGTLSLTGNAGTLKAGRQLSGSVGALTLSGISATLRAARRLVGATGALTLTGHAATFDYSGEADPVLVGDTGALTLTGFGAQLLAARRLLGSTGMLTLTGYDAGLVYSPIAGPSTTQTQLANRISLTRGISL